MVQEPKLPEGWTLDRVREIEPSAELLDPADHFVIADGRPAAEGCRVLNPSVILSFSGLCLCFVGAADGTGTWWMGQLDDTHGSIACWSAYGPDLESAIRAL